MLVLHPVTDAFATPPTRSIAIACQGGGSHTAFTAGVLSRLLAADELATHRIVGLSGTSGGAVCALLAWSALRDGDRVGAGRVLEEFWADNSATGPLERLLNAWVLAAGTAQNFGLLPGVSPYQLPTSAMGLDEFRKLLARHVDFERIEADPSGRHPMLLLDAVDVCSGEFRAFNSRHERITTESVLASAAIPTLFPAVHVDGGAYWDGLFSQNPPVRELLDAEPDELWVVQVNPRERSEEPRSVLDIADRRNELAGNLSLYQELGFIEKVDRLLEDGLLSGGGKYKQVVVRIIELPRAAVPGTLGPASKLDRDAAFLAGLVAHGKAQAEVFLAALAFERAWASRDPDGVMSALADDAELRSCPPFPVCQTTRDRDRVREFVAAQLCPSVVVDPVRKHIIGDTIHWSVRMRVDGTTVEGVAELEIGGAGVSRLHLGPPAGRRP